MGKDGSTRDAVISQVPAKPGQSLPSREPYRLAPVRQVRERAELVRRGELASAMGDAHVAEQALALSRNRTNDAREQLAQAAAARAQLVSAPADELARHERFIARCRGAVAAAHGAELRAHIAYDSQAGEVDAARAALARARAEREVIERHFARWREAQRALASRRED